MIRTRSPLRITLAGGATDSKDFYERNGSGHVISAAIDQYIYVDSMKPFEKGIRLKYSDLEKVESVSDISHNIIREAFRELGYYPDQIEITTLADVPQGTGLGSSSSFTVALLQNLIRYKGDIDMSKYEIAERACRVEIDRLKSPIGKQDQYASAFGGITSFYIDKSGYVFPERIKMTEESLAELEDSLMLFFTGFSRKANDVLSEQTKRLKDSKTGVMDELHTVYEESFIIRTMLEHGDFEGFAQMMNEHWARKRNRTSNMTNPAIDEIYDYALSNGALGGKLIGGGGGGFLLVYSKDPAKLRRAMLKKGVQELRFKFDWEGVKTL